MTTMRALTIEPGVPNSLRLEEFTVPAADRGSVLVRAVALGVCGTDREIIAGDYGAPPPGHKRLIIGHESLGRVEDAPAGAAVKPGDLVVGIVRHPDPVPCPNCEAGEWDMCRNGLFTEHGINALDGFGSEYFRIDEQFVIPVPASLGALGVLTEPTSIVAKAWTHIEYIGHRARWEPSRVLVTGAGPVGLLAALIGRQRGLEVHVLDRVTDGAKPALVRDIGATYHDGALTSVGDFDIVLECTGAPALVLDIVSRTRPDAIVCLTGVSPARAARSVDVGALDRQLVLGDRVLFGSVNANRAHYEAAVRALTAADASWLRRLITRRIPLARWNEAFAPPVDDVKTVVTFDDAAAAGLAA